MKYGSQGQPRPILSHFNFLPRDVRVPQTNIPVQTTSHNNIIFSAIVKSLDSFVHFKNRLITLKALGWRSTSWCGEFVLTATSGTHQSFQAMLHIFGSTNTTYVRGKIKKK